MNFGFVNLINLIFFFLICMFLLFFFLSLKIFCFGSIYFLDWEVINVMGLKVNFPILLDFYSSLFLTLIFIISSMIIIYSKSYMNEDKYKYRFILILFMFITSMVLFILSPNLISMLLGWDGLGLVSYCLVIHYQNFKANVSGMLTALSNRIGDCFLILSICYMMNFYSWNYLFLIDSLDSFLMSLIIFCSITKSAQIPFSSWLPAAMAAPTPVSSLVHSSTLVTAGVFLLIRFSSILKEFYNCMSMILMLGLLTTIMAGISANLEMDMKKIIALSTLSQLGIMMSSFSLGLKELTFFHLVMHALFKALMFMCSGNFIHLNFNMQDLRHYGKIMFISPLSSMMFSIANLSLCGFPFLCGFFSKDLILEVMISKSSNLIEFILFMVGTILTVMYTLRVLMFLMNFKDNHLKKFNIMDENLIMNCSVIPLYLMTLFCGYMFSEIFLYPMNLIILPMKLKLLVLLICLFGLFLSNFILVSFNMFKKKYFFLNMLEFFSSMFYLNYISKKMLLPNFLNLSKKLVKTYSNGWIENFYGNMNMNFLFIFSKNINLSLINKMTQNLMMVFLLIVLLTMLML